MTDAKYEVGQVVVVTSKGSADVFEVGTQVVHMGRSRGGSFVGIGREGVFDTYSSSQVRPLAPGEAATIDGRGYPIEVKAEQPADYRVDISDGTGRTFSVQVPADGKRRELVQHDGYLMLREVNDSGSFSGVALHHPAWTTDPEASPNAHANPFEPGTKAHECWAYLDSEVCDGEWQAPEEWAISATFKRSEVLGIIRASLGTIDGVMGETSDHEAAILAFAAQAALAGEILSRLQRDAGPPPPNDHPDSIRRTA